MAKRKKAKGKSVGAKVSLGATLAGAAVAAAAGTYYLYGSSGKKHQRQIKGWMLKAKGEILERAEKLKEVDVKIYHKLVDEVSKKYKKLKHVSGQDVARLTQELKSHWTSIEKDLGKKASSGKKVIKKVARKVAKRAVATKKAVLRKKPKGTKKSRAAGRKGKRKMSSTVQNKKKRTKK